jgi:hypothetical protein
LRAVVCAVRRTGTERRGQDVFEKYACSGYANDCTKPATRANFYFVNRLVDADHVQHDRMSGPQTDFVIVLNQSRG